MRFIFTSLAAIVLTACTAQAQNEPTLRTLQPLVAGLDHVVVAVEDLPTATRRWEALGFVTKAGRPHDNGIENRHVKFAGGTEIELLTVPDEGTDELTSEYRRHLRRGGDGPAFVALHAPDQETLRAHLETLGHSPRGARYFSDLPPESPLRHLFFGSRLPSPTDEPQHFDHPNTARALVAVWLAGDDLAADEELLVALGGTVSEETIFAPRETPGRVVRFGRGEGMVVLLPGRPRRAPDRPIVGVTVEVESLATARRVIEDNGLPAGALMPSPDGRSLFIPPGVAHGLWLELRQADPRKVPGTP
jgi:catechol 2,3-dioxygenase-like lactoylglutathione lyase family enzyme